MNREPFHCHPSIILEKAGGFLVCCILILLSQANEILPLLLSGQLNANTWETAVFCLFFMFVVPGLIGGYQFLSWKKTWISLEEHTLVIERNTLFRKKNTYSIPHIANINTEQNLFELLLHTCRIKIDLENATDANATDISIVLSMKKARELKTLLLALRQGESPAETVEHLSDVDKEAESYASFSDILTHCICSLSGGILVFALFVLVIGGLLLYGGKLSLEELLWEDKNADFSMKILAVAFLVISYGSQIIHKFLQFYHFTAIRKQETLIIRYGFFRRQDYAIPIRNIQAVRIIQAPAARLLHFYEAQMICVGIGDSKEELTQLSLCCKKSVLYQRMGVLLPEFSTASMEKMHKPPKGVSKLYTCAFLGKIAVLLLIYGCLLAYVGKSASQFTFGISSSVALIAVSLFLYHLLHARCQGFHLGKSMAVFSGGIMTKTVTFLPYQNIQRLCLKQGPLSAMLKMQHGSAYILASLLSRETAVPYLSLEEMRKLKENMAKDKT